MPSANQDRPQIRIVITDHEENNQVSGNANHISAQSTEFNRQPSSNPSQRSTERSAKQFDPETNIHGEIIDR